MLTRIIAVALLMLTAAPVLASDAGFDRRNLAASQSASPQTKGSQTQPSACSCACRHG